VSRGQIGGLTVIHTHGTARQRGFQHGRLLGDEVRGCFQDVWVDGFFRASPLFPRWMWYGWARLNERFLSPDERAELKGVAEGSGLRYADVLVMNGTRPIDFAHNLLGGGSVACTQAAVRGEKGVLLARNLDTVGLERLHRYAVVTVCHPDRGLAWLSPGFAGKVLDAVTGWNEADLIVSQDVAELPFEGYYGLYSGALMRRLVMHAADRGEALAMLRALPRVGGGGKIAVIADREGASVVEIAQTLGEGVAGRKRIFSRGFGECGDPVDTLVATNHYRTPELAARSPSRSSASRRRRASQLGPGADVEGLKRLLTDKVDPASGRAHGPQSPSDRIVNWYGPRIRRFGPFAVAPDLDLHMATTISTVCDPCEGVMWVAAGKPYVDRAEDFVPLSVHDLLER
jgi:hypothetical protein